MTCHQLAAGGDDGRVRSLGVGGTPGAINSPTVFNAGFNLAQFWDGRVHSLEEQVDGPVHNPVEMASEWPDVVAKLKADSGYRKAFNESYADGITADTVRDAIAAYGRTLITVGSRFDRWLQGEDVMTDREKRGYALFKSYGCVACHQGVNAGGNPDGHAIAIRSFIESLAGTHPELAP